jgi:hypothetical protein
MAALPTPTLLVKMLKMDILSNYLLFQWVKAGYIL